MTPALGKLPHPRPGSVLHLSNTPLAFLQYLHHAVPGGDGGPSPHPPSGGNLTEQLGQFALHLSLKHFILELLLNDTQEDYI